MGRARGTVPVAVECAHATSETHAAIVTPNERPRELSEGSAKTGFTFEPGSIG
jgi:hypothetical protein